MLQIGTIILSSIDYPSQERQIKFIARSIFNRFSLMLEHGFNEYSEENWKFFKEWYHNFYPNRKYYF